MDQKFNQAVQEIIQRDERYHADAYQFVNSAVSYTVKKLSRDHKPSGNRHVTAEELVAGSMDYAITEYGFLAAAVLRNWGLLSGEDFGNIVYNMIDAKPFLAHGIAAEYDETQSIGRRYRRQDELGTPYCVTVDFDTVGEGEKPEQKGMVTVRERDSMKQELVPIDSVVARIAELLAK